MDHKALLRAAEAPDSKTFVDWYENARSQNNLSVKEAVDRLSQKELAAIWMVLHKWVKESVESISDHEMQSETHNILMVMSAMAIYTLDNVSSQHLQGLKPSILLMNGILKKITCKKTGKSICEMSEKFWKTHPECESNLAPEVIEWLVQSILDTKGTVTAVSLKYLWSLKDAVLKFNPISLESSSLMQSLLSCACNSKFVSNPEGRKFVACLYGLSPQIVQLLHQQFKKNIPLATTAESEMFGEIYFRAWRHSPEHCRAEVESIIQDLMFCAVVAVRRPLGAIEAGSNKVAMNKILFHLLHAIHRQKKQRTVAVMIYNLYKPILWRFLEATNGLVRANALCLLFDAFPLESGEGLEEDEAVRNKQWEVILTSLTDPDPLVRSIAVQGTCQILTEYWDLIPLNIIQDFIACMLRKLLYDSSSPAVRSSVVKGMCSMLDNKQTHALLEKMIPLTSKVLHDVNEKVRVEYVNLLIRIQSLRVSKLWEVIDMKHLIVRLAVDASKNVCRRLVVLLAPFYNPKSQPEVVLERCLRLVMDNRTASRKFYEHVHCCSDIQQIAVVVLIIWKFLRNYTLKQLQQNRTSSDRESASSNRTRGSKRSRRIEPSDTQRHPDEDKENQEMSSDSENDTADDEEVNAEEEIGESTIFGLIDVLCILLSNNKSKMKTPQNLVYWKNIQHRFTKSCSLFFRYFRNSNGLRSIIYLYGLLSSNSSPIMLTFVKSQLKSLNDDATPNEFAHLLDALCNWGRGDDILEFVAENIQRAMTSLQPPTKPTQKTRGTRKSVQFESADNDDKPILGLRCMLYVLQNVNNKKMIFRQNLSQVEDLTNLLKPLMSLIENRRELLSNDNQFIIEATVLYVKLVCVLTSAHKRLDSTDGQVKFSAFRDHVVEILHWIERLLESETSSDGLQTLVCSVITTVNNMLMIHSAGSEICHQLLSVVNRMVDRFNSSSKTLVLSVTTAYLILDYIWVERSVGQDEDLYEQSERDLNLLLKKTLNFCSEESDDLSFTPDEYLTMRDAIREILTLCHRHSSPEHPILAEIVRTMVDKMETEMYLFVQNPECDAKCVKDLPTMTQTITLAFRVRNKVARMVLQQLLDSLHQQPKESILQPFLGTVKLLRTLSQDQGKISNASLVDIVKQMDEIWSQLEGTDSNEELYKSITNLFKETKIALRMD